MTSSQHITCFCYNICYGSLFMGKCCHGFTASELL